MGTTTLSLALTVTDFDYCDRCSARARAVVEVVGGMRLYFCGHHFMKNFAIFEAQGYAYSYDPVES